MPACAVSGRATLPTALPVELATQVFSSNVEVPGVEPDPSPYQGAAQTAMLHLVPPSLPRASNPIPPAYEAGALPVELERRVHDGTRTRVRRIDSAVP